MFSSNGDDFQEIPQDETGEQAEELEVELEVELEAGPRAERPNFLTATRFVDFDLPPEILEGLDKAGFEYCTPIQAQAIPVAMKGEDIAGQAQTGTGKTTAFLVPLLNRLLINKPMEPDVPRAIIVTPTRELALQIHEDAIVLAGGTNLRQALVIGGMEYKEQAELLAAGPEIVICTPGRIIDYLQQGVFKTKGIEVAVVDEADRLLDMGFIKDLKYLLGKLPPFTKRQTMLFSATLDERVLELTYQYMNPPQYITAEPDTSTKVNIVQELYHVGRDEKLSLLLGLLRREEHQRIIIFVNTKSGVEWLSKKLVMNGFQAEGITGDLPQPKRLKLMEAFKENRLQILVATDVASRGIHVDDVSHVYNYDLPQDAENYVHRIGRTARAGNTGKAVSFGCEDYVFHLEAIENLLGEKIPVFWAEAEWFNEDQGGEVRMKDRRGERRKGSSTSSSPKTGRGGDTGGERRSSRGPAKSQRPGGIFGLSPRVAGDGGEDARQTLSWTEIEDIQRSKPEIVEEAAGVSSETNESGDRDNGRRRKRRRGRRGRGGENLAPETSMTPPVEQAEPEVTAKAEATPPSAQAKEAAPSEPMAVADESVSSAAPKGRKISSRKPAYKKSQTAEAAAVTKPETAGSTLEEPPIAPAAPEAAALDAAQKKKPMRSTKKPVKEETKAKTDKTVEKRASGKAVKPAVESEVKQPKQVSKKAAPIKAEEAKTKPAAKTSAAKEAEAKKPQRTARKTEEAPEPKAKKTSPVAAAKSAKAAPAKKADEPLKKSGNSKKTEVVKEAVEAPKKKTSSRTVKKADTTEDKYPKVASKQSVKKPEAAESAPPKKKSSKKSPAES